MCLLYYALLLLLYIFLFFWVFRYLICYSFSIYCYLLFRLVFRYIISFPNFGYYFIGVK